MKRCPFCSHENKRHSAGEGAGRIELECLDCTPPVHYTFEREEAALALMQHFVPPIAPKSQP